MSHQEQLLNQTLLSHSLPQSDSTTIPQRLAMDFFTAYTSSNNNQMATLLTSKVNLKDFDDLRSQYIGVYSNNDLLNLPILHAAITTNSIDIIDYVIQELSITNANIGILDNIATKPLIQTKKLGCYDIVQHLIENYHIIVDLESFTSLFQCILQQPNDELFQYICKHVPNDYKTEKQKYFQSLSYLVKSGNISRVQYFITHFNINVHDATYSDVSFITDAIISSNTEMIDYIISLHPQFNINSYIHAQYPIHIAAEQFQWNIVNHLITHYNADPTLKSTTGRNLAYYITNDPNTTPELLEYYHQFYIQRPFIHSASLYNAAIHHNLSLMKHLINNYQVSIHHIDTLDSTLFHAIFPPVTSISIKMDLTDPIFDEIINYLCEIGCHINGIDLFSISAIERVIVHKNALPIVQKMVEHGANIKQARLNQLLTRQELTLFADFEPNVYDFLLSHGLELQPSEIRSFFYSVLNSNNESMVKHLMNKYDWDIYFSVKSNDINESQILRVTNSFSTKIESRRYYYHHVSNALHIACQLSNFNLVQLFLPLCDINSVDGNLYTPLLYAMHNSSFGIDEINILFQHGAKIDFTITERIPLITPLQKATKSLPLAQFTSTNILTCLCFRIFHYNPLPLPHLFPIVDSIIQQYQHQYKFDLDGLFYYLCRIYYQLTPQRLFILRMLIYRYNINPNTGTNSCLQFLAEYGHIDVLQFLFQTTNNSTRSIQSIDIKCPMPFTPLEIAIRSRFPAIVSCLVENKADVKESIQIVIQQELYDEIDILTILLQHGANIEINSSQCNGNHVGETPLYNAVRYNKLQQTKVLLQYNANINVINRSGMTLFHLAAKLQNHTMFELLLQHYQLNMKSNMNSNDNTINTIHNNEQHPSECSCYHIDDNNVDILNKKDINGITPFGSSVLATNWDITRWLINYNKNNNDISTHILIDPFQIITKHNTTILHEMLLHFGTKTLPNGRWYSRDILTLHTDSEIFVTMLDDIINNML